MVAIVIPVYKKFEENSECEHLALIQATNVFKNREIYFVGPEDLPLVGLEKFISETGGTFKYKGFPTQYFKNIDGYNVLCKSKEFYAGFLSYKYILLYQLDAYVFNDQLDYWCGQDFDYIGAPWCQGWGQAKLPIRFMGVGNGGLSLRKVSSFYSITSSRLFKFLYSIKQGLSQSKKLHYLAKHLPGFWRLTRYYNIPTDQEDFFWGLEVPKYFKCFKIPDPETAMKFSFEAAPRALYAMNNYELPFGCHAWEKYDYEFWKQFIPWTGSTIES